MSDVIPQGPEFARFWQERRLCAVTTLRPDGSPHVVPMGVVLDLGSGTAWAITSRHSRKVRNLLAAGPGGGPFAACQMDGRHWSTVEGRAVVLVDPDAVHEAERRYAARYKVPRPNPDRVAIRVEVTKVLGNVR